MVGIVLNDKPTFFC